MTRYVLELYNPDARKWLAVPNAVYDDATSALLDGLTLFDGIQCRATPIRVLH